MKEKLLSNAQTTLWGFFKKNSVTDYKFLLKLSIGMDFF